MPLLPSCVPAGNAGAILVLGRDLVMVPKLIHPLPPSTPRTPDSNAAIDEDLPGGTNHLGGADTWMQVGVRAHVRVRACRCVRVWMVVRMLEKEVCTNPSMRTVPPSSYVPLQSHVNHSCSKVSANVTHLAQPHPPQRPPLFLECLPCSHLLRYLQATHTCLPADACPSNMCLCPKALSSASLRSCPPPQFPCYCCC